MTFRPSIAVAGVSLALLTGAAHAAPITYNLLSQNVDGVVTSGTITTDGTIGVLGTSNITAFDIVLTQGGLGQLTLTNKTASQNIIGSNLSATSNGLSWNYSGGVGAEFSVATNASPNTLAQFHLYTNRTDVDFGQVEHFAYMSGVQQVASVSAVPLPSAAPMFGAALLAFAGLGYAAKRKQSATAA